MFLTFEYGYKSVEDAVLLCEKHFNRDIELPVNPGSWNSSEEIIVQTEAVLAVDGTITTPAIWVDAIGAVV